MTPPNVIVVDNKKYVWDGAVYATEPEAARAAAAYQEARFEVQQRAEGEAWFVFTRREVGSAATH